MGQASARIRGRRLQREREALFAEQPLCVRCLAKTPRRVTVATQRDHIVALANGGEDTPENTQPLCAECNLEKRNEELGYKPRQQIGPDGWPT